MMDNIQALGYGIIGFAIIIGVGAVVLQKFGGAVANCGELYGNQSVYNSTEDACGLTEDGVTQNGSFEDPVSQGWVNTNYLNTQIGSTGLSGWTPAIIAFTIGMLFLGYFMTSRGGRKY